MGQQLIIQYNIPTPCDYTHSSAQFRRTTTNGGMSESLSTHFSFPSLSLSLSHMKLTFCLKCLNNAKTVKSKDGANTQITSRS